VCVYVCVCETLCECVCETLCECVCETLCVCVLGEGEGAVDFKGVTQCPTH